MNTELLKRVAEKVGKKFVLSESGEMCTIGGCPYIQNENESRQPYDPENNPAQLVEMIEWLLERKMYPKRDDYGYRVRKYSEHWDAIVVSDCDTLAEACLLAIDGYKDDITNV